MFIHPLCEWSVGSSISASWSTAIASAAWPSANRALYFPIVIPQQIIIQKGFVANGAATGGTAYIGLYNEDYSILVSGHATKATSTNIDAITAADNGAFPMPVKPGRYYLAAMCTTTGTWYTQATTLSFLRMMGAAQEATGGTLPSTATPVAMATSVIPCFGFACRTLVA